jgi:hypothetical protein
VRQSLSEVEVKSGKGKQEKPGKGERKNYLRKSISRPLFGSLKKSSIIFSTYTASGQAFGEYFLIYHRYDKSKE